jgi:hypothetical protein
MVVATVGIIETVTAAMTWDRSRRLCRGWPRGPGGA